MKKYITIFVFIIAFFVNTPEARAVCTVTGVGTASLSFGSCTGRMFWYYGNDGSYDPDNFGDKNCDNGNSCSWNNFPADGAGGFPYNGYNSFYMLENGDTEECSGVDYDVCMTNTNATEVGCYFTDGSTWSEGCTAPSGGGNATSTMTDYEMGSTLFYGWLVFMFTAWGVISFFRRYNV